MKAIVIHDLYSDTITISEIGPELPNLTGQTLTGGVVRTINGIKVITYTTKKLNLKVAGRPELEAVAMKIEKIEADKTVAREAKCAADRAAQDAIDKPLLEAMEIEATRLRSLIPADHVEVIIKQSGDLDGDPILDYACQGIKLSWRDIEVVGTACAIRPRAMGAFATRRIASISIARLAEIKAEQSLAIATANRRPEPQISYGSGYCYSCKTYCYGDCGNYNPDRPLIDTQALREAVAEQDYGIND